MFTKNKKRPDSKIRWQNPRFRDRLKQARGYKRQARTVPQSKGEIFLSKVGLGSWISRFATLLVFLLLVYLVFIPNFFFIKHINITGGDPATISGVQDSTAEFLKKSLPWPQKNLLLMSKAELKNYLLVEDQKIISVNSINKSFPSTLNINISPRVDEFLIQANNPAGLDGATTTYYTLSNDGLVTQEVYPNASGSLPSLPFLIKLDSGSGLNVDQPGLSRAKTTFMEGLQNQLPAIVKSKINYYELSDLQTPDLTVYLTGGFKTIFDLTSDVDQNLNRLKLLFSQFSNADINNLYYVDMRFGDRAYVCNKNAACANNNIVPNSSATGTPDILPN